MIAEFSRNLLGLGASGGGKQPPPMICELSVAWLATEARLACEELLSAIFSKTRFNGWPFVFFIHMNDNYIPIQYLHLRAYALQQSMRNRVYVYF